MTKDRCIQCLRSAGKPRFHTWSLVHVAWDILIRIQRGIPRQPDCARNLLVKADRILGLWNKENINDPIIAEDVGGDEYLWLIRNKIREAIRLIDDKQWNKARNIVKEVDGMLYDVAIERIAECAVDHKVRLRKGLAFGTELRRRVLQMRQEGVDI